MLHTEHFHDNEVNIGLSNGLVQLTITWANVDPDLCHHMDGLMQERSNSTANALELRLSCINPSIWCY